MRARSVMLSRGATVSPPKRLRISVAVLGTTLGRWSPSWPCASAAARAAREVKIEDVEESLARDSSFKVRVEAALILGRLHQVRSVPALVGALARSRAGRARGAPPSRWARSGRSCRARRWWARSMIPSRRSGARPATRCAASGADEGPPRARASRTSGGTPRRPPRSRSSRSAIPEHRAGPVLQSHMRDFLIDQLRPFGDVDPGSATGPTPSTASSRSLSLATTGRDVEVSCAVQLVISRQPAGGVFMLTNGQATVQKPKRQWRPQLRPSMELEALEAAVRGASEDLVSKLPRQ